MDLERPFSEKKKRTSGGRVQLQRQKNGCRRWLAAVYSVGPGPGLSFCHAGKKAAEGKKEEKKKSRRQRWLCYAMQGRGRQAVGREWDAVLEDGDRQGGGSGGAEEEEEEERREVES